MKLPALAALLLLLPTAAFACLNVDGTNIDGHSHSMSDRSIVAFLRNAVISHPSAETFANRFGTNADRTEVQESEAKAVAKIYEGNVKEAVTLLKAMEDKWPNRYSTAANLGTAYELLGDNEDALKWITLGMERNPESHEGTEWLHVLILKAKLEAAQHPEQPLKTHLLNIPDRLDKSTAVQVDGHTRTVEEIKTALFHQLRERMFFVKPKDVYVGDLLYSYALIQANLGTVETGFALLDLAKEYGFADEALLAQRVSEFKAAQHYAKIRGWVVLALEIAAGMLLLWYLHHKRIFFLSHRAYREHKASLAAAKAAEL